MDCIFENLSGLTSSVVSVYESRVAFMSEKPTGSKIQFKNNVSDQGSTVYGVSSVIVFRNMTSAFNTAVRGGCIQIVSSEFEAIDSIFNNNNAELGGTIFAIQSSVMRIRRSELLDNRASIGSVVYSMANKINAKVGYTSQYV